MHAQIQKEACKRRATQKHESKLKIKEFQVGDLVRRMRRETRKDHVEGKLALNQEGPFRITVTVQNGTYQLEELIGKVIPTTWNATHLKPYFN